ncbi:unnamed protein product [Cylindrotheca closterium]|uniref:H15 domain-containing protein n=1 Tax=Cylindrotheca closterium TaxID=2856 RepID=A0AAD2D1H4_9STRA|nr:unnamed protein product [Cylindrotheca closterium]
MTMTPEIPRTNAENADSNAALDSPANEKKISGSSPKSAKPPGSQSKLTYIQMVTDAIIALKDRTGSSQVAIKKYILSKHPEMTPDKLKTNLNKALKSGLKVNRFLKNKASFKIHPDFRKQMKAKKSTAKIKVKNEITTKQGENEDRQAAKEKARLDRIRKRKFPLEDWKLVAEDKELNVSVKLPRRPAFALLFPDAAAACKTDTRNSGLMEDVFVVYHFFRGDIGWGLDESKQVAPFTLQHLLECTRQIVLGSAKRARIIPPLVVHLFTVALQNLAPEVLQVALTAGSWSEVLVLYMDAMERFCEISQSENVGELTGHTIDVDYLFGDSDEHRDGALPESTSHGPYYFDAKLAKIHSKLLSNDPWMLSADELFCLLRALVDDLVANSLDVALELDDRLQTTTELLKNKRIADANYRKLQTTRNRELLEQKQEEKERIENGIKATRSNTKTCSVSEAQLDSAKRSQQKATSLYEKAMQQKRIRTLPIGCDRQHNEYFHFHNDPSRLFVRKRGKTIPSTFPFKLQDLESFRGTWQSVDERSVLEAVKESLDVRGERELGLSRALEPVCKMVFDDIKESSEIKQQQKGKEELERKLENAKLKCEFGRKSGRLVAQSEKEVFSLQAEVDSLEHNIGSQNKIEEVDVEEITGLNALRSFDKSGTVSRASDMHSSEPENYRPIHVQCSNLWSTGGNNGTGLVGCIIRDLLQLEERVERLTSATSINRRTLISNLESASQAWHANIVSSVENNVKSSSAGEEKNDTASTTPRTQAQTATSLSANQILTMLKQPVLLLEDRVFQVSGLAVASQDAEDADDNMSTSPEGCKAEELGYEWKRLVHRLGRIPAKAHSRIRRTLVEAISAARKGQNAAVVAELRDALLQYHPGAAGACKAAALSVLEQHGGFIEEDDCDIEGIEDSDTMKTEATVNDFAAALSAEAVILSSSLEGCEDATRADWINAVKRAKTFSKLAALAAGFHTKASKLLNKMEEEHDSLMKAIKTWEKVAASKGPLKKDIAESSEVWAEVKHNDDFCLAKIPPFPWWPARKVTAKDKHLGDALRNLDRCLVSLVGELGGLRVVKTGNIRSFSDEFPGDEDLTSYSKDVQDQLDDCMKMARRIIRGRSKTG